MNEFGRYVREKREQLLQSDKSFSLRQVAGRIGIEPTYLSKIERGGLAPPSEQVVLKLAHELGENPDILLAIGGKVSQELKEIILQRPELMADLLRQIKDMPEHAILRIVREVKDGDW
ncbi:MAG: helix-turn-helix transcriptional regulator [Desulfuromonadales bacterium]|nr:helix-turn-helix transcriptional regulator [Desulfuromonadales bacterium]